VESFSTDHVNDGAPPDVNVNEYGRFKVAAGSWVFPSVLMLAEVAAAPLPVRIENPIARCRVVVPSVMTIRGAKNPSSSGIPDTTPVEVFSDSPAGNRPYTVAGLLQL
jgi:hypothetical protein